MTSGEVRRLSIDGQATVKIGEVSWGGLTRGDHRACDHDVGLKEKYIPCGIVDEETAQLHLTFGSSYKPETMVAWAKSMTWKGIRPIVELSEKVYQKGVTLSKRTMRAVEARLERHPELPN